MRPRQVSSTEPTLTTASAAAILDAVAAVAQRLLTGGDWRKAMPDAMAHLGEASGASRAHVFRNHPSPDGRLLASQMFEWCAPGVDPYIDDPGLQDYDYVEAGYDDGPGVPDVDRERIFDVYHRDSAAPGSGVGLSLVARFAELHGGRAWVAERPGGGASFRVWLPSAPAL